MIQAIENNRNLKPVIRGFLKQSGYRNWFYFHYGSFLFFLFSISTSTLFAQKTDYVKLENGNELIGEIRRLNNGLLEYSVADILGRLQIKWEHVLRLESNKQLDIELRDGRIYLGSLLKASEDRMLRLKTDTATFEIPVLVVAFIKPLKPNFFQNLDGSISTGLSFTKATDVFQFSLGGEVVFRSLRTLNELSLNTIINTQRDQEWKTNTDIDFIHLYILKNRWYLHGGLGFTRNDELGIDSRSSISAGGGRRFVRTPRIQFLVAALLSGNRENRNDGSILNNLESVLNVTFVAHKYDSPRIELNTNLATFFSLSSLGRVRFNVDLRLSLEIVKDLYWDISQFYFRFDTDPSVAASSRTDYGLVTNIRYRFGRGTFE